MSTVGYGDYHATTSLGKMIVTMMIIISLVVVPMQVNQLVEMLALQSGFIFIF